MKNLFPLSFLIVTVSSCSSNYKRKKCPEKWQLVKMTDDTAAGSSLTGSDMNWQEWYLLSPDSTFIKTRNDDSQLIEARGTYTSIIVMDGKFLELAYASQNELIGSCVDEPIETLILKSANEMTNIWSVCDGPGLFYEKTEYDCD